jgi:hypothetical protein
MSKFKCKTYSEAIGKLRNWYQTLTNQRLRDDFGPPNRLPQKAPNLPWKSSGGTGPSWTVTLKYSSGQNGVLKMGLIVSGKLSTGEFEFSLPRQREVVYQRDSYERARNDAIKFLQDRGVHFDGSKTRMLGTLGDLKGKKIGWESPASSVFKWEFRLDYDPNSDKAGHFNVKFQSETADDAAAFTFPGGKEMVDKQVENNER